MDIFIRQLRFVLLERGNIVHRAHSQDLLKDEAAFERLIGLRLAEEADAG